MSMTDDEAALVARYGSLKGSPLRRTVYTEARGRVRQAAEAIMEREVKLREAESAAKKVRIIDIIEVPSTWHRFTTLRYFYQGRSSEDFRVPAQEAAAILAAWAAGKRVGAEACRHGRPEDER